MTREHDGDIRLDGDQPEEVQVAEIRADIEETRVEMGGTLNELGERLEPGHLVNQAKENVREATIGRVEETAKGMSDMVMETIKRNPIPAAIAGAGLAMLWANRSQGTNGHDTASSLRGGYGAYGGYGYASRRASMYDSGGDDLGTKARDTASGIGENVQGAVGTVAETAQQTAGEVVDRAGQTVNQVGWQADRFMQANPLAVGAIALGAGALIGSLVPETPQEREFLGDASRQVGNAVRDTVDQAATKAEETMDRAEEHVSTPA